MRKSLFEISKMDCPSEEQMIRLALGKYKIENWQFDLPERRLTLFHNEQTEAISNSLDSLNLDSKLLEDAETSEAVVPQTKDERRVLWILLAVNFTMFVVEIGIGFFAESAGLIADSLDMLADSLVYSMSLYAVGRSTLIQHRAAQLSGWFQLLLAAGAFGEVIRRFIFGSEPNSMLMMGVSTIALLANASCLFLLMKHRQGAVHMRASWIFSTNDVMANLGVILAGTLVFFFKSPWPDLVIGILIGGVVTRGAISILKMSSIENE